MPKLSKIQPGFGTGEISRQVYGRVDNPRYETGLQYCQNYLPIVQGPLIRRPGTKFVAYVKDVTRMPALIPFQFSATQNYMLEFGDKYIRFYQNEGQILTSSTSFFVAGFSPIAGYFFTGVRTSTNPQAGELISQSAVINAGSVLQIPTPYSFTDVNQIKFAQKQDTLYLTHPQYQPQKLVRTGLNTWDLKAIYFQDGPYLPLNSYQTLADSATIGLSIVQSPNVALPPFSAGSSVVITTYPLFNINNVITASSGNVQVFLNSTPTFNPGDKVFIKDITSTTELNNVTNPFASAPTTQSSVAQSYWTVSALIGSSIQLQNAVLTHSYVGSTGTVQPALFQLLQGSSNIQSWQDIIVGTTAMPCRPISYAQNGVRLWGTITGVTNAASVLAVMAPQQSVPITFYSSAIWAMGVYNRSLGFPSATTFHQNRLLFAGSPAYPQQIDGSMTGLYEQFSASGSTYQVTDQNAYSFTLNSQDSNNIQWIKSNPQGLLCGTLSGEWAVTPSTQNAALTPTNISANLVTSFGSYNTDAVLSGNALIYIQRAARKVRELLYYWQVGNFRSTNLSEMSQHITIPTITKLVNQKEPHPFIWGLRGDGALLSLTYNRDDVTFAASAGWARHILGGRSDATGTQPLVQSLGVIPSGDGTYDEVWLCVKRFVNGVLIGSIEYMTKPFDDFQAQESAFHLDFGQTYNSSIVITNVTNAAPCMISALNHGLSNSSTVRFYNCVGLTNTTTDVNGVISSSNVLNEQVFQVCSTAASTFYIQDFLGNAISTASSSVYVGSCVVNTLVTQISGLSYLAGETVGVVADGGIHVNTSVTQAGVLNLAYPAAVVQVGYPYNSDAQMLRTHEGSAQGTSIGSSRRVNRVAFMLHNVGDFSFGPTFQRLIPCEFGSQTLAGVPMALFDGIHRDGIESQYGFDGDAVCFRQSSGLPGMIQSITRFIEESDV